MQSCEREIAHGRPTRSARSRGSIATQSNVDHQIDQRVEQREQQHDRHRHRIVAREDRLDGEPPEARNVEDGLDHEGGAQQAAEDDAGLRQERHQGVAEGVAPDHHALGHALGAGGAHIILLQHLEHEGAREPGQIGRGRDGEDQHRQHRPIEAAPARDRQHAELDAQEIDQKGGEREIRDRQAGHQEQDDGGIGPAVAVDGGAAAREGAERERDGERRQRQHRADREPVRQHLDHRRVDEAEREPEIALRHMGHIGEELPPQRLVEPVLGAQPRRQLGVGRMVAQHDRDRIARQRLQGRERQHDGDRQDRHQAEQAADQEDRHCEDRYRINASLQQRVTGSRHLGTPSSRTA